MRLGSTEPFSPHGESAGYLGTVAEQVLPAVRTSDEPRLVRNDGVRHSLR